MHKYRVVHRTDDDEFVALRDGSGRYHVARPLKAKPPLRALLQGDKPHLGFGMLLCTQSGQVFRMIFERINDVANELDARR